MVYGTSGEPQYIKAYHGCYDPLSYPLFFLRGEVGWNKKILYAEQGDPVEGLCVSLCLWFCISLFIFSISSETIFNVPVDGGVNVGQDKTEAQGNEGQFLVTYFYCIFLFMNFYLCQFIISVTNARWRCNGRYCWRVGWRWNYGRVQ
jgi:hypothetical protein